MKATFRIVAMIGGLLAAGCTPTPPRTFSPPAPLTRPTDYVLPPRETPKPETDDPPPPEHKTAAEVAAATVRKWDPYSKTEKIGAPVFTGVERMDHLDRFQLFTSRQDGGTRWYLMEFGHRSDEWYFHQSAHDSSGRELELHTHDRDARNDHGIVDTMETHLIKLSRPYLEAAAAGPGLDLRIDGKRGRCFVKIPAYFVKGFLDKVDQVASK